MVKVIKDQIWEMEQVPEQTEELYLTAQTTYTDGIQTWTESIFQNIRSRKYARLTVYEGRYTLVGEWEVKNLKTGKRYSYHTCTDGAAGMEMGQVNKYYTELWHKHVA